MSFLKVDNINAGYGKKQVLFDVSFEMKKGETVLLVGANGSGKSSLLKVIYGLLEPWNKEAKIWLMDEEITNFKPARLLKKGMVYIPQKKELFEDLSVKENLEVAGMQKMDKERLQKKISEILERRPKLRKLMNQECSRLSGGERKYLSLSMAEMTEPEIIIYDEPLAGISPKNYVIQHLENLKKRGISLLLVEHRIKPLSNLADQRIELKLGKISNNSFALKN